MEVTLEGRLFNLIPISINLFDFVSFLVHLSSMTVQTILIQPSLITSKNMIKILRTLTNLKRIKNTPNQSRSLNIICFIQITVNNVYSRLPPSKQNNELDRTVLYCILHALAQNIIDLQPKLASNRSKMDQKNSKIWTLFEANPYLISTISKHKTQSIKESNLIVGQNIHCLEIVRQKFLHHLQISILKIVFFDMVFQDLKLG